jgi:L,D-peptidoglycan transpeptidase YkuD (ErfK/YbiS/YcfS/YnhG family)
MKFSASFLMLVLVSITTYAQEKTPDLNIIYPKSDQLQAIVVTTQGWNTIQGRGQIFERQSSASPWVAIDSAFPVVIGAKGMAWGKALNEVSADAKGVPMKIEGDGKSPAGIFMLTSAFSPAEQKINLPFTKLLDSTECVDDVKSSHYNTIVDKSRVDQVDWNSSEKMRAIREYELGIFVGYNSERKKGAGSCIFLHRWTDEKTGTTGCTAMALEQMQKIFRWIDSTKNPILIQLPEKTYQQLQSTGKLPQLSLAQ